MIRIYLYDLLQSKGWTQRQLHYETGVREATISRMCNNKTEKINVDYLNRICKTLNCKVGDLLEYIPDDE